MWCENLDQVSLSKTSQSPTTQAWHHAPSPHPQRLNPGSNINNIEIQPTR
jgi:hypothetical protein